MSAAPRPLIYIVCAARCDEKRPFQERVRKTMRKVGGAYFCPPCYAGRRPA